MNKEFTKEKSPFNIRIDRQVIKLLGAHLYGDTPSVVNELVANAYDARAKHIWISIKTTPPYQIQVQDDGVGMSLDDINNYYLNIGYNRREQPDLQEQLSETGLDRLDMGQKGIGKLAVFALSKQVRLISVKNGNAIGCFMDFDTICQNDGQPVLFDTADYHIEQEMLSENNCGTLIILENVVKNLSKSYKFLASNLARSFVLNNEDVSIFIRKNNDDYKPIKRANLDYTKYIDVLATIGNGFTDMVSKVQTNTINPEYKRILKYEDLVNETSSLSNSKKIEPLPIELQVFNKNKSHQIPFEFKFTGWIGTVQNEDSFKDLLINDGFTDDEISDKDIVITDDNRITIYSRGKVGEYNILPKLKTKAANDAYLVGEIFVDDFESDELIDMATSNRRGYQEDDPRYEALCRNLKLLVSRIVTSKQAINKKRKADAELEEANKIKKSFTAGHIKSKHIFESMGEQDRMEIEEDHKQFARAVALSNREDSAENKKLLISHRSDGLENYGNFIIDILLSINPNLANRIVFTSNAKYGLPKGKDLFESLKDCFRPDFYVVFLFTKSFYDSNTCLAEAGAAWATNTKYMNIVIDIPFSEIDKPLNRDIGGAKFSFTSETEIDEFVNVIKEILYNIDKEYDFEMVKRAVISEIEIKASSLMLPNFLPHRKYQFVPLCPKCNLPMELYESNGKTYYKCSQRHAKIKAKINK